MTSKTSPPSIEELRTTVAAFLGTAPGEISPDANLIYLGLGSLEVMRLATRWRRQGLSVDLADLAARPTLAAWHEYLTGAT